MPKTAIQLKKFKKDNMDIPMRTPLKLINDKQRILKLQTSSSISQLWSSSGITRGSGPCT